MKVVKLSIPQKPTDPAKLDQEVSAYLQGFRSAVVRIDASLADVATWAAEPPHDEPERDRAIRPGTFSIAAWWRNNLVSILMMRELQDTTKHHSIVVAFQWLSQSAWTGLTVMQVLEPVLDRGTFSLGQQFRNVPFSENPVPFDIMPGLFSHSNRWEQRGVSDDGGLSIQLDVTGWGQTPEEAQAHFEELELAYRSGKLADIFGTLPGWLGGN
ncbi:MAG TPA: hypothetical protein VNG90_01030 [Candidatus Acidoferrum sp.]|nr:hypothetical protein [Candidatus Acidoferrum sp.]